jgi:hypothetical protein
MSDTQIDQPQADATPVTAPPSDPATTNQQNVQVTLTTCVPPEYTSACLATVDN